MSCADKLLVQQALRVYEHNKEQAPVFSPSDEKMKSAGTNCKNLAALVGDIDRILGEMPEGETKAYFEAKKKAPHLVAKESDPTRYLRCLRMDPRVSATRIAEYWMLRFSTFGDRALLPMTCDGGQGALNEEDRELLATGFAVVLPEDAHGRAVICLDSSRRLRYSINSRLRNMFYISQVISENEKSQTEGYVTLTLIRRGQQFEEEGTEAAFKVYHAMPNKVCTLHLIDLSPETSCLREFETAADQIIRLFPTPTHRYKKKKEYLAALAAFGLQPEGLPRIVGGTWSYEKDFAQWRKDRVAAERKFFPPSTKYIENGERLSFQENDVDLRIVEDTKAKDSLALYRVFLKQAIDSLPHHEKEDYLAAIESASEDIHKEEANVNWFLIVHDLNCLFAAKSICQYWTLRKETFAGKAYHPLNQTGEGALCRTDIFKTMLTSFTMLLPSTSDGSPLLWINPERLETDNIHVYFGSIKRSLFYMFSLLAQSKESRRKGVVLLWMLHPRLPFSRIDMSFVSKVIDCLPVNIKAVHLLHGEEHCKSLDRDDLTAKIQFTEEVYYHKTRPLLPMIQRLSQFGITRNALPKQLGGDWGFEKFCEWRELRTRLEWKIPQGLSGKGDVASSFRMPAITPYAALSEGEKVERNRRLNVIHSRRKRDRLRFEKELAREQEETPQEECNKRRKFAGVTPLVGFASSVQGQRHPSKPSL